MVTVERGSTVPSTRADLRYLNALDLAGFGLGRWRTRYRLTARDAHRARLRRRAQYWSHATDRPRLVRPVVAAVLDRRVRRLGPVGDIEPGPRGTTLTADQVRLARSLVAEGRLSRAAVADAFWVTVPVLEEYLVGGSHERDSSSRAS